MNLNSKACVICLNKKPVNHTDNRLVTEACGHVKCMNCLLQEKDGCIACVAESSLQESTENSEEDTTIKVIGSEEVPVEFENASPERKPETSHIIIVKNEDSKCFLCTVCNKTFHSRSQVAYHSYCNGQRKPYQCHVPDCKNKNKSFASLSHYKYHMRVHRDERTYSCDQCSESFFQMSKLQRHKLKHTKEKKHACTKCNKAFNNQTSLRKHSLTHTDVRPYVCDTCGRAFRDSSNYKKHMDKHNESSPLRAEGPPRKEPRAFQCPCCPQAFHSKKDMRRHSAVHSDSKPFRCKVCDRRFRRKDNLERHIRNTHPDCVPSSVVEFDQSELSGQTDTPARVPESPVATDINKMLSEEKNKLEIMNPLPPLPKEVFNEHLNNEVNENVSQNMQQDLPSNSGLLDDKSYIIEANNARESVIREPIVKRATSPDREEYVHKIRKANFIASQKIPLPPVDKQKFTQLVTESHRMDLAVDMPTKNVDILKKILGNGTDSTRIETSCSNPLGKESDTQNEDTYGSPDAKFKKMKFKIYW